MTPLSAQAGFDLAGIVVVNTHLHFDRCGGDRLFAGKPTYVQRGELAVFFAELDEPRTEGQRLVRALDPEEVWLAHAHGPWRLQEGTERLASGYPDT